MLKKATKKEANTIERHFKNPLKFTARDAMKSLGHKYDHNHFARIVYRVIREAANEFFNRTKN